MDAKTNFETGKEYTLAQLFSNNNKIIIPDLQRDYCWGTKNDLAKNFVISLYDYYDNRKGDESKLGLGIFYGYEEPAGHMQLCDGQQRLTTLFLLIGMLNRYSGAQNQFKKYLISEEEMDDNKEPYLLYSIRESTLYFLSDLIIHIFFTNNIDIKKIKEQAWYFKDYDFDPSIQSMLETLSQIDEVLPKKENIKDFGDFLLNDLTFLYYDLKVRKNGEETFVIINTTGEPLTATENLKPLLLSKIESESERKKGSDTWEKWEQFFWNNRSGNDTSDNGLKEFFRWIMLLSPNPDRSKFKETQDFGKFEFDKNISIEDIDSYFDIVLFIKENEIIQNFTEHLAPENSDSHNQIIWFQVLPVIKFIKRWGKENQEDIKRISRFFFNLSRLDNVGKAITKLLPEAIRIIDTMNNPDVCSFLDIQDISKSILTEEEKLKLKIYKQNKADRNKIQTAFWEEEDYKLWNGEIYTLLSWTFNNTKNIEPKEFAYERFSEYAQKIKSLFKISDLDILIRTLLTFIDNDGYPAVLHGYTNYTFCNTKSDWKTIFSRNRESVRQLLDLLNQKDGIEQQLEAIMKHRAADCAFKYNLDKLIKHKEILRYSEKKNFQWDEEADDWRIIPKERATRYANLSNYVLFWDLVKNGSFCNSQFIKQKEHLYKFSVNNIIWDLLFYNEYDGNCCVVTTYQREICIDLYSQYKMTYNLNIRNHNDKIDKNKKNLLEQLAEQFKLKLENGRYYSENMNEEEIIMLLQNIITTIN